MTARRVWHYMIRVAADACDIAGDGPVRLSLLPRIVPRPIGVAHLFQ